MKRHINSLIPLPIKPIIDDFITMMGTCRVVFTNKFRLFLLRSILQELQNFASAETNEAYKRQANFAISEIKIIIEERQ